MKKLIVVLMLGSLGLFSCQGTQDSNQNTDNPMEDENGTMQGDTTEMDTTGIR